MAEPSVWSGTDTSVNSAHVYIKAVNSAGTVSLGALAGGASTDHAACGLCKTISHTDETETMSRKAENCKTSIKEISGQRTISYEIEAMVDSSVNISLATGLIADHSGTSPVGIPASPESIYGDVVIYFMKDESDMTGSSCVTDRGVRYKKVLITPMGFAPSYDGSDMQVYRYKITPYKDASGYIEYIMPSATIDATDEYLTIT